MKKSIFLLLISVFILALLSACGGKQESADATAGNSAAVEAADDAASTAGSETKSASESTDEGSSRYVLSKTKTVSHGVTYEYKYDADGRVVEEAQYDSDGVLVFVTTYAYEPSELGYICTFDLYTPDGTLEETTRKEYDDAGHMLHRLDLSEPANEYSYDGDLLVSVVSYNGNGEESGRSEYEYDDNGYLIKSVQYINGEVDTTKVYENDGEGHCVKMTTTDAMGEEVREYEYVCTKDAQGRVTEEYRLGIGGGRYDSNTYTYDDQGNLVMMKRENPTDVMSTHFREANMYYYYAPLAECLFTQSLISN